MSVAISITYTVTGAESKLQALRLAINPQALNEAAGRSVATSVRDHLYNLNSARPNALGGRRTNYYAGAADSTHMEAAPDKATVTVSQTGFALRFHGGTVTPVNAKMLTIPVNPAAYGMRAREFPDTFVWRDKDTKSAFIADAPGNVLRLLFLLTDSATIPEDPSLLPSDSNLESSAIDGIRNYLDAKLARLREASNV